MFESAVLRATPGRRARSVALFPLAVLTHMIVLGTVLAVQLLAVDELRPPLESIGPFRLVASPPPPEGPPPAPRRSDVQHPRRAQAVQPSTVPDAVPLPPAQPDPPAQGSGVEYGVGEAGANGGGGFGDGEASAPVDVEAPGPPAPPEVLTIGGEVLAPVIVARVVPAYPPIARQAGRQGPVRVQAVIDREGNVVDVQLLEDRVGFGCGEAALAAIRQWRFRPATMRGRPVSVFMEITVAFTLSRS